MAVYRRKVTGVSTLIQLVKTLCKLLIKFQEKIYAWIDANMPATPAATVKAWLEQATIVCAILVTTPDD